MGEELVFCGLDAPVGPFVSFGVWLGTDPEGCDGTGDAGEVQKSLVDGNSSSFGVYYYRQLVGVEATVEGETGFVGEFTF